MFCPACGAENQTADFCANCETNLAIIKQFLAREDATARRSRFLSRTGLVSLIVSEGFAWALTALAIFVLIILLATVILPRYADSSKDTYIASGILLALMIFCGVPLLLGLVLLLKDFTYTRPKKEKNSATEDTEGRETK
jgi:hypothetical protein